MFRETSIMTRSEYSRNVLLFTLRLKRFQWKPKINTAKVNQ